MKNCMAAYLGGWVMFYRAVKTQLSFIMRQRMTQIVMALLLCFVGYNFVNNVIAFQGRDVSNMYHPMKLLTLSYNRMYYNADVTLLFTQLYPLLVACPAGLVLAREKQMRLNILLESRIGRWKYNLSKIVAVFIATTLVFLIPFVIEIGLNVLAFPLKATWDLSNRSYYDSLYIQMVENYWFSEMYVFSPYLYAAIMTTLFAAFSGLLAAMVMSFSSIFPVKFRVMYLILPFVLLNSTIYILPEYTGGTLQHVWYKYLLIFADGQKNGIAFAVILVGILLFTLVAVVTSGKKDSL